MAHTVMFNFPPPSVDIPKWATPVITINSDSDSDSDSDSEDLTPEEKAFDYPEDGFLNPMAEMAHFDDFVFGSAGRGLWAPWANHQIKCPAVRPCQVRKNKGTPATTTPDSTPRTSVSFDDTPRRVVYEYKNPRGGLKPYVPPCEDRPASPARHPFWRRRSLAWAKERLPRLPRL